jgi:hypothetical protein
VTPTGIKPEKDKLKAVEMVKVLETKEEIKSFVGFCNFFRHISRTLQEFALKRATEKRC